MYGSDAEYSMKPHEFKKCSCPGSKTVEHCWYCGGDKDKAVHVKLEEAKHEGS